MFLLSRSMFGGDASLRTAEVSACCETRQSCLTNTVQNGAPDYQACDSNHYVPTASTAGASASAMRYWRSARLRACTASVMALDA